MALVKPVLDERARRHSAMITGTWYLFWRWTWFYHVLSTFWYDGGCAGSTHQNRPRSLVTGGHNISPAAMTFWFLWYLFGGAGKTVSSLASSCFSLAHAFFSASAIVFCCVCIGHGLYAHFVPCPLRKIAFLVFRGFRVGLGVARSGMLASICICKQCWWGWGGVGC